MATLYKFKLYCETESKVVYTPGYQEEPPSVCPNGVGHTIDPDSIRSIDSLTDTGPTDVSGKQRVQQTSRKLGLLTDWVGIGDNISDPHSIGGGQLFSFDHKPGEDVDQTLMIDLNCCNNETWLHEGYIDTEHCCGLDTINFQIVTRATSVIPASNTNFKLYGGYLIIPASGDGNINLPDLAGGIGGTMAHDAGLVFIPPSADTGKQPPSYWKATWDTTTKQFKDIVPAPNGDGNYNMFATEIPLSQFVTSVPLRGTSNKRLQSSDTQQFGHGMRMKLAFHTGGEDHDWGVSWVLTMYRAKTI